MKCFTYKYTNHLIKSRQNLENKFKRLQLFTLTIFALENPPLLQITNHIVSNPKFANLYKAVPLFSVTLLCIRLSTISLFSLPQCLVLVRLQQSHLVFKTLPTRNASYLNQTSPRTTSEPSLTTEAVDEIRSRYMMAS